MNLFNLPTDIVKDIIFLWLGLKDIQRLDNAILNKQLRPLLLELLLPGSTRRCHRSLGVSDFEVLSHQGLLQWVCKRNISIQHLRIQDQMENQHLLNALGQDINRPTCFDNLQEIVVCCIIPPPALGRIIYQCRRNLKKIIIRGCGIGTIL